jgi:hypothetical protein
VPLPVITSFVPERSSRSATAAGKGAVQHSCVRQSNLVAVVWRQSVDAPGRPVDSQFSWRSYGMFASTAPVLASRTVRVPSPAPVPPPMFATYSTLTEPL